MGKFNLEMDVYTSERFSNSEQIWINERMGEQYYNVASSLPSLAVSEHALAQSCLWILRSGRCSTSDEELLLDKLVSGNYPNLAQTRQLFAKIVSMARTVAELQSRCTFSDPILIAIAYFCETTVETLHFQLSLLEADLYTFKISSVLQLWDRIAPFQEQFVFLFDVLNPENLTGVQVLDRLVSLAESCQVTDNLTPDFLAELIAASHEPLLEDVRLYLLGAASKEALQLPTYIEPKTMSIIETMHSVAVLCHNETFEFDTFCDFSAANLKASLNDGKSFGFFSQKINRTVVGAVSSVSQRYRPQFEQLKERSRAASCELLQNLLQTEPVEQLLDDTTKCLIGFGTCPEEFDNIRTWCLSLRDSMHTLNAAFVESNRASHLGNSCSGVIRQQLQQQLSALSNYTSFVISSSIRQIERQYDATGAEFSFVQIFPHVIAQISDQLFQSNSELAAIQVRKSVSSISKQVETFSESIKSGKTFYLKDLFTLQAAAKSNFSLFESCSQAYSTNFATSLFFCP